MLCFEIINFSIFAGAGEVFISVSYVCNYVFVSKIMRKWLQILSWDF